MCALGDYTKNREFALKTDLHPRGPEIIVHYEVDDDGIVRLLSILENGRRDRNLIEGLYPEKIKQLRYKCLVDQETLCVE